MVIIMSSFLILAFGRGSSGTSSFLILFFAGLIFLLSRVPKVGAVVFAILAFVWEPIFGFLMEASNARSFDAVILIPLIQSAIMIGLVVCLVQIFKNFKRGSL